LGVKNATLAAALVAFLVAAVPLAFKLDARYAKQQKLDEIMAKVSEIQLDINSLKAKQDLLLDEQKHDRILLEQLLETQGSVAVILKMQNGYQIDSALHQKMFSGPKAVLNLDEVKTPEVINGDPKHDAPVQSTSTNEKDENAKEAAKVFDWMKIKVPPKPEEAKPAAPVIKKPAEPKNQLLEHQNKINELIHNIDEIKSSLPNKTDK